MVNYATGLTTTENLEQLRQQNNDLSKQLETTGLANAQQLNNLNKQLQTTTLDFAKQLNELNKKLSDKTGGE